MSFSGGILTLLVICFTPLTRRRFSAIWHRSIHCVLLAFYAIPAGPLFSTLCRMIVPHDASEPAFLPDLPAPLRNLNFTHPPAEISSTLLGSLWKVLIQALPAVWSIVTLGLLLWHLLQLRTFQINIERTSTSVTDQAILNALHRVVGETDCHNPIRLLESPCIQSPIITVLRRNAEGRIALVLPPGEWGPGELQLILRHELTHYRQRDLWVKWAGLLLRIVHWYNPAIHLLVNLLNRWIERACDEILVQTMDASQRRAYGRTILDVLARTKRSSNGIHAALCEDKQDMKERLTAMIHAKPISKKQSIFPSPCWYWYALPVC